jgi:hypothetical protein
MGRLMSLGMPFQAHRLFRDRIGNQCWLLASVLYNRARSASGSVNGAWKTRLWHT